MSKEELEVGVTVQVPSENRQGEIYRLPPNYVNGYDSEGEDGKIHVMLLDELGLYDYVITCDEDDFEVLEG